MKKSPVFQHGGVWPLAIPVSLSWAEVGTILALIHELEIKTFVEIGVEHGGLASLLQARAELNPDFEYYGIEIDSSKVDPRVQGGVTYADVFSDAGLDWLSHIVTFAESPILIFFDGGDKPREAAMASHLLTVGYILVHDYKKEFKDKDQPEGTGRIEHPWLRGTRLFLMAPLSASTPIAPPNAGERRICRG